MLEVKRTGQHGCTAVGSGRNIGRDRISFHRYRGDSLLDQRLQLLINYAAEH